MSNESYGQFCPLAMASEILASRWTLALLGEMQSGSTRFNEIRRGVPRMSPALLSKRLKELEAHGVVRRVQTSGGTEYRLTKAGEDLEPIIHALGEWSMKLAGPMIRENPFSTRRFQAREVGRDPRICGKGIMASGTWIGRINRSKTWPHPNEAAECSSLNLLTERRPDGVDHECTLPNLDARLLMWNMRRKIDPKPLPRRRVVVEFIYPELPPNRRRYWLIVSPTTGTDLCSIGPGFEVDLYVRADLKARTSAWMGMTKMVDEVAAERIVLTGDPDLIRTLSGWMKLSSFAAVEA